MIKIFDGWEIDSDMMGYVVRFNTGKKTVDKNGVESTVYTNVKYPSDIPQALKIIKEFMLREKISKNDYDLAQAIEQIKAINEKFENELKKVEF